ncbi:MAG: dihydroorotate dehydrogenase [Chitinispirillia bacterium]|nr:dihydroorotate dehydrogenase [Chitinispirillia bacterium]MCL2242273.1 dihydroorotate dehydrogenase [Chitinispirillia bacterium]
MSDMKGMSVDLSVKIGSKLLPNPVGVASGTFGYGREYEELIDLKDIGAIFTKAVTVAPREGNTPPRIVETPSGILNSIGLANVGVDKFIADKLPFLKTVPCAVVVNVAGSTEDEYHQVIEKLESANDDGIWGYEVNVSCPNVRHGGLAFGTDPAQIERLTSTLRKMTKRPLVMKLTPNVTDITVIAKAAEAGGADAISLINTLVGMVINVKEKRSALGMITGGLSGPAVRPVGVALTYKASRAVSIPVIGMGGIMTADDALQYLLAGASAVQIGTANFVDPHIPRAVLEGIRAYCVEQGLGSVGDIRGLFD